MGRAVAGTGAVAGDGAVVLIAGVIAAFPLGAKDRSCSGWMAVNRTTHYIAVIYVGNRA
ncbi:hypothetical protein AA0614_1882 [Komagataeibacter saccharivorans NRIC 0614]|nr:hypothetical protein AA0614_1882 [Komagataeibacter saccharivorans NRIC 0614]